LFKSCCSGDDVKKLFCALKVAGAAVTEGLCVASTVQLGMRDAACIEGSSSSDADAAQQVALQ